jgi:hypothetical protein
MLVNCDNWCQTFTGFSKLLGWGAGPSVRQLDWTVMNTVLHIYVLYIMLINLLVFIFSVNYNFTFTQSKHFIYTEVSENLIWLFIQSTTNEGLPRGGGGGGGWGVCGPSTLPAMGNLKLSWKASPSLFTHAEGTRSINMYIYSWKPVQKSFLMNSAQSFLSNNAFIQIKFLVEFTFSFFSNSKVLAPVNCMVLRENRKGYYINMCLHHRSRVKFG